MGCSSSWSSRLPATYQSNDLRFLYPENWQLSESDSDALESASEVSLESPSGGLWALYSYPASADVTRAVGEIISAINEQYDDVEWNEANEPFHGYDTSGYDG